MKSSNRPMVVFFSILGFLAGIVGSFVGIAAVSSSATMQKALGITTSNTGLPVSSRIENITVKEDSGVISSVKKVSPAVVSIIYTKDVRVFNPFLSPFDDQNETIEQQQGGGTGFVITSDGLIATNRHVANIDGAEYSVISADGKKYDAKVVSKDPIYDFAILKIDVKGLPTVEFGDSDDLEVGQRVIAVGNTLGEFQNSVTVGVLSGKERTIQASDQAGSSVQSIDNLLQTDAAINEGNSGGPLVNLKSQVIGINTATTAKGQAEGVGFAIPINSLKTAIDSISKYGKIVRPYIGIRYATVDEKIIAIKGMKKAEGVLIVGDESQSLPAIVPGSPADKAGLKEGDVILKINNDEIKAGNSLTRLLSQYQPGDEVTLKILREDKELDVKIKFGEMSG